MGWPPLDATLAPVTKACLLRAQIDNLAVPGDRNLRQELGWPHIIGDRRHHFSALAPHAGDAMHGRAENDGAMIMLDHRDEGIGQLC
jgi:hypothetical protein